MNAHTQVSGTLDVNIERVGVGSISVAPVISRDHFAVAAMQALLSYSLDTLQTEYVTYQLSCPIDKGPLEMVDWVADRAYQIADAMEQRRWK